MAASDSHTRLPDSWCTGNGRERSLQFRWLLNPDSEPLEHMVVTEFKGRVVDIRPSLHPAKSCPLILIPPLANLHTHLEFSGLDSPLSAGRNTTALPGENLPMTPDTTAAQETSSCGRPSFAGWIQEVIRWRMNQETDRCTAIIRGLEECRRHSVRLIGEILTDNRWPLTSPLPDDLMLIAFREAIGLRPERIAQQLQSAAAFLADTAGTQIRPGLSPHAPYTVHPELFHELISMSVKHRVPLAMHLAETPEELQLLSHGDGPLADLLKSMDLFDTKHFPGNRGIPEFLQPMSTVAHALLIHGNYLNQNDIRFLSQHRNITTVFCPRTHRFFGHGPHPFRALIDAGCRVVLGTDSRASSPDLNIWRELQYTAQLDPGLTLPRLLRMITSDAAEAVGLDSSEFRIRVTGRMPSMALRISPAAVQLNEAALNPAAEFVSLLSDPC